ncbi:MAG TPA: alanine racemase, partial [Thermoanaerobaculia bacterium]|nr:alanine racemase [Thermoanaerobaculia bacterium]
WLDMVRPGIMIYGFRPDPATPDTIPLKPGMSLVTRVSFLKRVPAGTSIGYGRTWVAPRDTFIATIPAGYADGFNRLFSNRGRVLIGGRSYPLVGRVCMDQSMVDLGPETDVRVGDEVVLMGRSGDAEIRCEEWAEKLGTITYEVTCQVNPRVTRVYDPY